jgi:hypothetical protein
MPKPDSEPDFPFEDASKELVRSTEALLYEIGSSLAEIRYS